jgi:hypothetical protein
VVKKKLATVKDVDEVLDALGVKKGSAREKAKNYCIDKIKAKEGQCLPTEELTLIATSYFDGYSESLRGG